MNLDKRVTIEYPVATQDADFGTPVITWALLATVWANVQDELPSRSEVLKQGLVMASRRSVVRFRYRTDVTSAMRIVLRGPTTRTLQIISPPSEIGMHLWSEVMCEEYSS